MSTEKNTEILTEQLKELMRDRIESGHSVRSIAIAANVPYLMLHRFYTGQTLDIKLTNAQAVVEAIGRELKIIDATKKPRQ